MKKQIMMACIVALGLVACNNNKTTTEQVKEAVEVITAEDDIIYNSVTNIKGETLQMKYDNMKGTAVFTFGDETIDMVQDTTASGVKFSNEHYEYEEWQGIVTLKKDGNIIFEYQD